MRSYSTVVLNRVGYGMIIFIVAKCINFDVELAQ